MAIESKPSTSGATQPTLSDMMDLLQAAADYIRFYITKIVLNKILKRLRSIRLELIETSLSHFIRKRAVGLAFWFQGVRS